MSFTQGVAGKDAQHRSRNRGNSRAPAAARATTAASVTRTTAASRSVRPPVALSVAPALGSRLQRQGRPLAAAAEPGDVSRSNAKQTAPVAKPGEFFPRFNEDEEEKESAARFDAQMQELRQSVLGPKRQPAAGRAAGATAQPSAASPALTDSFLLQSSSSPPVGSSHQLHSHASPHPSSVASGALASPRRAPAAEDDSTTHGQRLNQQAVDNAHSSAERLLKLLESFEPAAPNFQPAARRDVLHSLERGVLLTAEGKAATELAMLDLVMVHMQLKQAGLPNNSASKNLRSALEAEASRCGSESPAAQLLTNYISYFSRLLKVFSPSKGLDIAGVPADTTLQERYNIWRKLLLAGGSSPLYASKQLSYAKSGKAFTRAYPDPTQRRKALLAEFRAEKHRTYKEWVAHLSASSPAAAVASSPASLAASDSASPLPELDWTQLPALCIASTYSDQKPESNDPWLVKMMLKKGWVDPTAAMLHLCPAELLKGNPFLCHQLLRDTKRGQPHLDQARAWSDHASNYIGEYAASDLFMLAKLREQQLKSQHVKRLFVIMLPSSAIENAMRALKDMDPITREELTSDTRPNHAHPQKLTWSKDSGLDNSEYKMYIQYLDSFPAAVRLAANQRAPLRVVYVRTLMWFTKLAAEQERQQLLTQVLADAATEFSKLTQQRRCYLIEQFPPNLINATYDDKKKNARLFAKYMLPQQWEDIPSPFRARPALMTTHLKSVAKKLLQFMRAHPKEVEFVLKGSHATCETCFHRVRRTDGSLADPDWLMPQLREQVEELYQHCIGIQPFSKHLRAGEYRVWLVVVEVYDHCKRKLVRKLQILSVVLTRPGQSRPDGMPAQMESISPDYALPEVMACKQMVQDMLADPSLGEFFMGVLRGPAALPALRIDCFYNPDTKKAYMNEMAPTPDAVVFTATHGTSLIRIIGSDTAERVWQLATHAYEIPGSPSASPGGGGWGDDMEENAEDEDPYVPQRRRVMAPDPFRSPPPRGSRQHQSKDDNMQTDEPEAEQDASAAAASKAKKKVS